MLEHVQRCRPEAYRSFVHTVLANARNTAGSGLLAFDLPFDVAGQRPRESPVPVVNSGGTTSTYSGSEVASQRGLWFCWVQASKA
jgi:hypothetical protein